MANVFPNMTFNVAGRTQSNLVVTGIWGLVDQGYGPLAALVFFCSIAAPGIYLLVLTYALAATAAGGGWPLQAFAWRWAEAIEPWSLVPVYAVACLVAVVRLRLLGSVSWDDGAFFIVLLSLCCLALGRMVDRERIDVFRGGLA